MQLRCPKACARPSTPTSRCAATSRRRRSAARSTVKSARLDAAHRCARQHLRFRAPRRSTGGGGRRRADAPPTVPLRFDVEVARAVHAAGRQQPGRGWSASADLRCSGTYDRPVLLGRADSRPRRGQLRGAALSVTRGTIDFTNPTRIEPFFDVEAETNVRVPGARPDLPHHRRRRRHDSSGCSRRSARIRRCRPPTCWRCCSATSRRSHGTSSCSALQNPNQAQTDILTTRATQVLTGADFVGGGQGRRADVRRRHVPAHAVARRSVRTAVDAAESRRRASRSASGFPIGVYLTFSRSLGTTINDQIVLLEIRRRAIGCPGSCRATRISRPTRSNSA